MKASVDVRDLMTLRAAALQVQAKRGASFAPPKPSIPAAPLASVPKAEPDESVTAPAPRECPPVDASPVDAGPWPDGDLPDDLIDQLAGEDAWPGPPDPEVLPPRRLDPTPPPAPAVPLPAAPSPAPPSGAEVETDGAFSLPDFTQAAPGDGGAGAQLALAQLLRDQLRAGAERGRARVTREPGSTDPA